MLSDKMDFKIDRALHKSNNFPDSRTKETGREQTGGSVCVKLLRLYSRSERKLAAVKQVSNLSFQVESGRESHFSEVLSRISPVETDFTSELGSRLWGFGYLVSREDQLRRYNTLGI